MKTIQLCAVGVAGQAAPALIMREEQVIGLIQLVLNKIDRELLLGTGIELICRQVPNRSHPAHFQIELHETS